MYLLAIVEAVSVKFINLIHWILFGKDGLTHTVIETNKYNINSLLPFFGVRVSLTFHLRVFILF